MIQVLDSFLAYRPVGRGPTVLLLHGNPTSSYLWRHVLDRADDRHCWVAPDLIGMGASGKPAIGYRFADHARYLDAFIDALGLAPLIVVGHDWGVALALDLACRRPDLVRAVGFLEGHLRPLPGWEAFDDGGRELFRTLRTPGTGEEMVLEQNFFLDTLLPAASELGAEELVTYRQPYPDPDSRRPLLQWAREIPIGGEPADVAARLAAGWDHLRASPVPKLLVHGDPGVLVTAETAARCRVELPNLTVVDVGPGGHFLPEDQPVAVAEAVIGWVGSLD